MEGHYGRSKLYAAVLVAYRVIFRALFGGRTHVAVQIPATGPVLLMSNHIHALDPFTLGVCVPGRQVHFLAKKELFSRRWLAWLLRKLHAISVGRGEFDMAAMRQCAAVLRAGEVLGIFPEGSRGDGKTLGPLLSGAAVLALRSQGPVVPVYIDRRPGLFAGQRVAVGQPVEIEDLRVRGADKEAIDVLLGRVRVALEGLRAQCDSL